MQKKEKQNAGNLYPQCSVTTILDISFTALMFLQGLQNARQKTQTMVSEEAIKT